MHHSTRALRTHKTPFIGARLPVLPHPQIVLLDVDGTLKGKNGRVSEIDGDAIQRVMRAGVVCGLATGRPAWATGDIAKGLSLNGPIISNFGALIQEKPNGTALYRVPLDSSFLRELADAAQTAQAYLELYTDDQYFCDRQNDSNSHIHEHYFDRSPIKTDLKEVINTQEILKAVLIHPAAQPISGVSRLRNLLEQAQHGASSAPDDPDLLFTNIVSGSVCRSGYMNRVATHFGCSLPEFVSIGDSATDRKLWKAVPFLHSIAMGNAPLEIIQSADFRTETVEQSGVAVALRALFPNSFATT